MEENYYATLGIKFEFHEHPDKAAQAGAGTFVGIRAAHEILDDPALRLNYDRFRTHSPEWHSLQNQQRTTFKKGLKTFYIFYFGAGIVFFLMNLVGKDNYGRYWRFILLAVIGAIEMSLVLTAGNGGG
ncbi:hypothetical protein BGZ47_006207 [Haplosporangium gracile]|nr:hypothetical protein BGZ47_006207 [Haplosporangium gracile]